MHHHLGFLSFANIPLGTSLIILLSKSDIVCFVCLTWSLLDIHRVIGTTGVSGVTMQSKSCNKLLLLQGSVCVCAHICVCGCAQECLLGL